MSQAEEDERAKTRVERRKIGRPSKYSIALARQICERIAKGQGLAKICEEPDFPDRSNVFVWLQDGNHKEFQDLYLRAQEAKAALLFDEIKDIADDEDGDIIDGPNGPLANPAHVNRDKLRIHARLQVAARLDPKRFGADQSANVQVNLSLSTLIGQSFTDVAGAKLVEDLRGAGPGATAVIEAVAAPVERAAAVAPKAVAAPAKPQPARKKIKKKVKRSAPRKPAT